MMHYYKMHQKKKEKCLFKIGDKVKYEKQNKKIYYGDNHTERID